MIENSQAGLASFRTVSSVTSTPTEPPPLATDAITSVPSS